MTRRPITMAFSLSKPAKLSYYESHNSLFGGQLCRNSRIISEFKNGEKDIGLLFLFLAFFSTENG